MSLDRLRWAKFYATVKHGDQKYGSLPYTHHLAAVAEVIGRFYSDLFVQDPKDPSNSTQHGGYEEAAWLHDVIEDTRGTDREVKRKDIAEMFGERVADLVTAVTDEPGENRKIRKALTYPKIRACQGAVALKLADRIANIEAGGDLKEMYRKEQEDFRRALYTPGEYEAMWKHLETLLH